jgi:two-component system, chemotaxis family, sensor kinase CheA
VDSLLQEFLQESGENLDRLDREFVLLEADAKNQDLLGSIFRSIHTIKGTCGFLGFTKLESIAHAGENVLSQLRAGELELSNAISDALLQMVDAIREVLQEIQASEAEGAGDYSQLVALLKSLQAAPQAEGASSAAAAKKALAEVEKSKAPATAKESPAVPAGAADADEANAPDKSKNKPAKDKPAVSAGRLGGALVRRGQVSIEELGRALEMQEAGDRRRLGEILISLGVVNQEHVDAALRERRASESANETLRIDVHLLEKQMNLVGELVLLRNQMLQITSGSHDRFLNAAVHALNFVTSELRKNVMKTRMQPISQLYDKFPRLIRDVSKDLGKTVRLETFGGDTELDKTLLEAIKDPVTHILRNSLDHGIETPKVRAAAGKPEEGTVRIRAYHEGGNFQLEISDDGAGIDAERVKQKAISKGLVTAAQAAALNETELQNFIFAAGLSTAEKVTNVSGRGVGMDVVKTNVEKIGGRVKLESVKGRGTKLWLDIPLTLATIPSLTVIAGGSVLALPQAALVEMIALDAEDAPKFIEWIDGVSVFRFRGNVIPLIRLRDELRVAAAGTEEAGILKLVVVKTEGRQFALQVDAIRNTEEIVIKPLDKRFKVLAIYAGAAVLGDGRVALILDVPAFARRAGVFARQEVRPPEDATGRKRERVSLLLLRGAEGERRAVPLEFIQRLEEFDNSIREHIGGQEVVQYRTEILRLVRLDDLLEERRAKKRISTEKLPATNANKFFAIVVRSQGTQEIILEVNRILGIVKMEIEKLTPPVRSGVRGSLVVQERITELLDMPALLAKIPALGSNPVVLLGSEHEQTHGD